MPTANRTALAFILADYAPMYAASVAMGALMEAFGWIWWILSTALSWLWAIVWFLLGGWVVTLAQVAVVALVIFGYKYGWAAAPAALSDKLSRFAGWGWAWVRKREHAPAPVDTRRHRGDQVRRVAVRGRRQFGDVNLSSLLNGLMIGTLLVWSVSLSG